MKTGALTILLAALIWSPATQEGLLPVSEETGCAALATEFDTLLRAQRACTADADCACYPDLRIDGRLGVTDRDTAARATMLSNRYRRRQCPTIFTDTAGPVQCHARCVAGTCR